MDKPIAETDPPAPEHFLAVLHGLAALVLGAAVWSALAALFGPWSLLVAPGLGWLVAWACRYGGRRPDGFVKGAAWLMAPAGVSLALLAFSAFSVTQSPPDSSQRLRSIGVVYAGLFTEIPWSGSVAVLLALAGAWFALREGPARLGTSRAAVGPTRVIAGERSVGPRPTGEEAGSRAA